jgi:CRP-like cAMP-binding protein
MLPKREVHCLLAQDQFRSDFIKMLMRKQRHLTQRILNLTLHDMEDRFFLFLREQYGERQEYTVNFSKKDIAAAIWTNPETLSRLIQRLKRDAVITWSGRRLALKDEFWESWRKDQQ